MYVKATSGTVDQYPYTVGHLRRDNPNTSFPRQVPDEMLAEYGVYPVQRVPVPNHDARTQVVSQNAEPHLEQGQWFLGWSVSDKTAEQITEYDDRASARVRERRNELLAACDWIVVYHTEKGTNIPFEWELYRQQLRDITTSDGFPHSVSWPSPPA